MTSALPAKRGQAPGATTACAGAARFGVRQLAAAFLTASLLAGISIESTNASQQAGSSQSGSKLPHSKASRPRPMGMPWRNQQTHLLR
ncbi:MAG: hypothetical protein ABSF71_37105 [Terriglobia bacterium]